MGRTESPDLNIDYERALVGTALFIESEMALLFECMLSCARKLLDTADIVRDAMLRQLKTLGANQVARHFTRFCRTATHSGV